MRDYPTLHLDTNQSRGTGETIQHYTQIQIRVEEQERLSNITLRYKLEQRNRRDYPTLYLDTNQSRRNMRDYPTLHLDTNQSRGTGETIQHYTQIQIRVEEQERLSNITLRYKLEQRNRRDYPTLHLDTNQSKGT